MPTEMTEREVKDKARRRFEENGWAVDPPPTLSPNERRYWLQANTDFMFVGLNFTEECNL